MKIDKCAKIKEWIDSSIGQSTMIQELKKENEFSKLNQTQNRRRYVTGVAISSNCMKYNFCFNVTDLLLETLEQKVVTFFL